MFVGLRAAFVALAGMALVAASNALPGETVAIAVPAAPQPDQSYAFKLDGRSEEHTSELQSLMRISYAVFCLKKKTNNTWPKTRPTTAFSHHCITLNTNNGQQSPNTLHN